jgi:CRISPR-associated protein Cas8a1/Csx13
MIARAVKPKVELSLSDPGMTMLHRAGVAGLYMTLKALEKFYPTLKSRRGNFKWVLTNKSISLDWQGNDYEALDWLFKESFQINKLGLISFVALDSQTFWGDKYLKTPLNWGLQVDTLTKKTNLNDS